MNQVILIGRVGKDPITKKVGTKETLVSEFSLATSKNVSRDSRNPNWVSTWHNIKVWGRVAEKVESEVRKGDEVFVQGEIDQETWDDKNGQKHYKTVITGVIVRVTAMAGSGKGNGESQQNDDSSMNESPW